MSSKKAIAFSRKINYVSAMDAYVKAVVDRFERSEMSLTELCRRAEIAHSTWVRIKQGRQSPTIRTMDKIERALDEHEGANAGQ